MRNKNPKRRLEFTLKCTTKESEFWKNFFFKSDKTKINLFLSDDRNKVFQNLVLRGGVINRVRKSVKWGKAVQNVMHTYMVCSKQIFNSFKSYLKQTEDCHFQGFDSILDFLFSHIYVELSKV